MTHPPQHPVGGDDRNQDRPRNAVIKFGRDRLLAMRNNEALMQTIRRGGSPLALALGAALATLDETPTQAQPASRAVVSNDGSRVVVRDDGRTIWLALQTRTGTVAVAEIGPVRAIALADELIRAALPRLSS